MFDRVKGAGRQIKLFLGKVFSDPLGVTPDVESPKGQVNSSDLGKAALAAIVTFVLAHQAGIAALLGPTGIVGSALVAGVFQLVRFLARGYAPAVLRFLPEMGVGVVHPVPGDPGSLGFFRFAGYWSEGPPPPKPEGIAEPAEPLVPVVDWPEDAPATIPFPTDAEGGQAHA